MPPSNTIGSLGLVTPTSGMKIPVENAAGTSNGYVTPAALSPVFNVRLYGALGDGSTNDAAAIDAAVAAASATGGTVYFPPGRYAYSGTGIAHDPPNGTLAPLYIVGAGRNLSQLLFTSVTGDQCIRISSQSAMGSTNNLGGGVSDITVASTLDTKDVIVLDNLEFGVIERVYTYSGRRAIHLDECRSCVVRDGVLLNWTGNAVRLTNETTVDHHDISVVKAAGTGASDWACHVSFSGGLAGSQWTNVTVSQSGQGAFFVEYTGASAYGLAFQWFSNCVGDGSFTTHTFYFKDVSEIHVIGCHGLSHVASRYGFLYDGCVNCEQVGGVAYADGASGADIAFSNSCSQLTFSGVRSTGTVVGYRAADSSTHTGITIDGPPSLAPVAVSDQSKLTSIAHGSCVALKSADQSIAHNTFTTVTFDTEETDGGAFHSGGTITATARCRLLVTASIAFQTNATGQRYIRLVVNGSTVLAPITQNANAVDEHVMNVSAIVNLAEGDTLVVQAAQTSGGALNVLLSNAGNQRTRLAAEVMYAW